MTTSDGDERSYRSVIDPARLDENERLGQQLTTLLTGGLQDAVNTSDDSDRFRALIMCLHAPGHCGLEGRPAPRTAHHLADPDHNRSLAPASACDWAGKGMAGPGLGPASAHRTPERIRVVRRCDHLHNTAAGRITTLEHHEKLGALAASADGGVIPRTGDRLRAGLVHEGGRLVLANGGKPAPLWCPTCGAAPLVLSGEPLSHLVGGPQAAYEADLGADVPEKMAWRFTCPDTTSECDPITVTGSRTRDMALLPPADSRR